MDDATDKRLRDTADECVKAYEAWTKSKKDMGAREALMEALHELRKVASRLEIEVAVSERDEITGRPIPIPPHRAAQGKPAPESQGRTDLPAEGRDPDAMRRRLNPRGPRPVTSDQES